MSRSLFKIINDCSTMRKGTKRNGYYGAYQAAVYDCAVIKEYQGKGFGKILMENILSDLKACNIILYASPGREGFYEKQGFLKMKTGMAYFRNSELMKDRGFTE